MSEALPNTQHATSQDAMSVSELTLRVKEAVESHFTDVWVTGEISNLVRASSGHTYLSLKDESSLLRAVIWRGTRQSLAIEPVDGLAVVCHGRLEVYAPRGSYQLTIDRLHAIGTGALETQLRKLHATLKAEGLFDLDQKRPLPTFPKRVALVTSPTGAAVMDFLETLLQRWPSTE
ncbi:MAG: exodeoxyribonuclease VII large subunit, partial [Pirellulales bacterium]|nr:exodeoxyribonuclease VII large subunit [Pirellulales bacterium]